MENQTDNKQKKPRSRSPGYPSIDLETAIDRARTILDNQDRHPALVEAVLSNWGYARKSSGGLVTLAALKKFGLIDYEAAGKMRQVRLSSLALTILLDDREDSPDRDQAIQDAALKPAIHEKLWKNYGGSLPSDSILRTDLVMKEKFNRGVVDDFIKQFRRTISFAKLGESDILSGHEEDKKSLNEESLMPTSTPSTHQERSPAAPAVPDEAEMGTISFPLSPEKWVTIRLPKGLSDAEWSQIKATLDVFKPGFTREEKNQDKNNEREIDG